MRHMIKIKQKKNGKIKFETYGTGEQLVNEFSEGIADFCHEIGKRFGDEDGADAYWRILLRSAEILLIKFDIDVSEYEVENESPMSILADMMSKAISPDDGMIDDLPFGCNKKHPSD